jgi:hypothetical protein
LNRAPIRNTTSAFCNAKVRAAATDSGWSSGITPLPIGERRNGICVRSIKARTSSSARDHATTFDNDYPVSVFRRYSHGNVGRLCSSF